MSKDTEDILMHYGVLGMKWGVRKDRRSKKPSLSKLPQGRTSESADHKRKRALSKKKPSQMSNKELKDFNERVRLEKEYSKLTAKDTLFGKDFLKRSANTFANQGVQAASSAVFKSLPKLVKMIRESAK